MLDLRYTAQSRRRGRRVGDAVAPARGRDGLQKVLADEVADEAETLAKLNRQANESRLRFDTALTE